jgi:oxygen-dependent protoporphyrinogen oxidase
VVDSPQSKAPRIAVIGGGISGLAAAHRLTELNPACQLALYERRPRLGGALWTKHEEGYQVEQGVDNFITTLPWGLDLCRRLGLEDELVQTNPQFRKTYVVRNGRLHKLPDGFLMMAPTRMWPLVVTPILSPLGKLRCALEYFLPPHRHDTDESVATFVRRRLGREAYERLVEPLVSAVYAADLDKLSIEATLPRFRQMERDYRSVVRAMRHQMKVRRREGQTGVESGPRFSMFVTLRRGLTSLVDAIVDRLPDGAPRTGTAVDRLEPKAGGWRVWTSDGGAGGSSQATHEDFDSVIMAAPSHVAADLLRPHDATLADDLATITHSGTAILSFAFDRVQIAHPLDGMGIVVPGVEKSPILACSLSSQKYVHRAPEGRTLLRVFVGGARYPEMVEMPENELRPRVLGELAQLLGIDGQPIYSSLARWPRTMPQYYVGHKELVERIEKRAAALPNFALCGNAYRGVGIPDCVHAAEQAAEHAIDIVAQQ